MGKVNSHEMAHETNFSTTHTNFSFTKFHLVPMHVLLNRIGASFISRHLFFNFIHLYGYSTPHDVTIADGTNHHVCLTWDLFAGNIKVYVDSKKIYEVNKKWTTSMPTNGTWIIGQYQLRFEDRFATDGSMKGMLAGVNIWGRILCRYEIVALASSCGPIIKGDVKSHNDFDIIGVVRFKPACCLSSC